jgi:Flp pilus assembly protein TadG
MAAVTPALRAKRQRGAALVEFAIVLPVLLLMFTAMIDFGLIFQRFLVLTNAAREGARIGVLPGYTTADVQARTTAYYAAGTTPGAGATVTVARITVGPGAGFSAVEVVATAQHTPLVLGSAARLVGGTFGTVTLRARAAMRIEGGS